MRLKRPSFSTPPIRTKRPGKSRRSLAKNSSPSDVRSPLNKSEDCPSPEMELPPDAIECGYPSENMCLTLDLEGALRELEKEFTDVMEDKYITFDFPLRKTSSISMKLAKELLDRSANGTMRIDHLIESIIDKDYENTEEQHWLLWRIYMQMMRKLEYEVGCPVKCASTVFEFYNLIVCFTLFWLHLLIFFQKDQFESFNEKLTMKKYYIKEVIRYQRDMKNFLNQKDKQLRGSEIRDAVWKCMEAELAEALEKNREMGIVMKEEYDYIADRDDMGKGVYRDGFRSFSLKEKIGVRTHEEEMETNRKFACTPVHILKTLLIDRKKTRKIKFDMSAFPTTMNTVDADHSVIPRPTIDHLADIV
ncbi:hypothetical protein PRIPAC_85109 [Pristionchus pacificus]|nr:hypothetical protein PRIPAC_85109 [Pristionchus pacificus]